MKTYTPLLLALCLAFGGPTGALAASEAVVQPINDPDHLPPGPVCILPPLTPAAPAASEREAAPDEHPEDQRPLLCACLLLDDLGDQSFAA